jgi:hypothetical protein
VTHRYKNMPIVGNTEIRQSCCRRIVVVVVVVVLEEMASLPATEFFGGQFLAIFFLSLFVVAFFQLPPTQHNCTFPRLLILVVSYFCLPIRLSVFVSLSLYIDFGNTVFFPFSPSFLCSLWRIFHHHCLPCP